MQPQEGPRNLRQGLLLHATAIVVVGCLAAIAFRTVHRKTAPCLSQPCIESLATTRAVAWMTEVAGITDAASPTGAAVHSTRPQPKEVTIPVTSALSTGDSGNHHTGTSPPVTATAFYAASSRSTVATPNPQASQAIAVREVTDVLTTGTVAATQTPTHPPTTTLTAVPTYTPTLHPTLTRTLISDPYPQLGHITFCSASRERPGVWFMDSTGEGRRYLGPYAVYKEQIKTVREQERLSPDGQYQLLVKAVNDRPQVFFHHAKHDAQTDVPDLQITHFNGLSYDPVWSPDGSKIAFVSTENGSDDIWVVSPDGTGVKWLINNEWEWDKHPSWSPDSKQIAFWSNRSGRKQIYVMDSDGSNVRNISNSEWDEYEPIWIK